MPTSPIIQQMSDKSQALEQMYKNLAEKQKKLPDVVSAARTSVMTNDPVLTSTRDTMSNAMLQMFQADKDFSSRYADPNSELFVADPYQRSGLVAKRQQGLQGEFESAWKIKDNRQSVLEDVVKAATERYKAELAGDELAIKGADASLANSLALFKEMNDQSNSDREFGLKQKELESKYGKEGSTISDNEAYSRVVSAGGKSLLDATSIGERAAVAKAILSMPGKDDKEKIMAFRANQPISDLLNQDKYKEVKKGYDGISAMLQELTATADLFKNGSEKGGTGPISGLFDNQLASAFRSTAGKNKIDAVKKFTVEEIKKLSGAAVSDKERAYLSTGNYIPSTRDDEADVTRKIDNLTRRLKANAAIIEQAAIEGITPTEAYNKYFTTLWQKMGGER